VFGWLSAEPAGGAYPRLLALLRAALFEQQQPQQHPETKEADDGGREADAAAAEATATARNTEAKALLAREPQAARLLLAAFGATLLLDRGAFAELRRGSGGNARRTLRTIRGRVEGLLQWLRALGAELLPRDEQVSSDIDRPLCCHVSYALSTALLRV